MDNVNDQVLSSPPLPVAYARRIEEVQQAHRNGKYTVADMPGYVRGGPPRVQTWHNMDYLDVYPKVWGRTFGANGIGRLREVALTTITENEYFPLYKEDPRYFQCTGLPYADLDIKRMQDQSFEYEEALRQAGVVVHRVSYPQPPVGAFGPLRSTWAANELLVVNGGSIIEKLAISPFGFGRSEYLALWAFSQLGIPPILAITGKGVAEAGPCFWLAEDVFVAARGIAYNDEGLSQLLPVVRRSTRLEPADFTALVIQCSGGMYFDPEAGTSHHPDMVLGPLDVDKVIAYPPGLDFNTWTWLKDRGYHIVEVDRDEQVHAGAANVTILEPGRVIMHAEAPKAVAAVRALGVDVTEVPYSEFLRAGGGVHCSTLRLWREPGPFSTDR